MKKVVRKLNRVLSVLLTAAMVVGSVPEAGFTVNAAGLESETETEVQGLDGQETDDQDADDAQDPGNQDTDSQDDGDDQSADDQSVSDDQNDDSMPNDGNTEEDKESETTLVETTEPVSTEVSDDNTAGKEEDTSSIPADEAEDENNSAMSEDVDTSDDEVEEVEEIAPLADSAYKLQKVELQEGENITEVKYLSAAEKLKEEDYNAETEGTTWKDATTISESDSNNNGSVESGNTLYIFVKVAEGYRLKTTDGDGIEAIEGHSGYYKVSVEESSLTGEEGSKTYTLTLEAEEDKAVQHKVSLNVTDETESLTTVSYAVGDAGEETEWKKAEDGTYSSIDVEEGTSFNLKLDLADGYTATVKRNDNEDAITPDENGVYQIGEITADTVINVVIAEAAYEPKTIKVVVMDGNLEDITIDFGDTADVDSENGTYSTKANTDIEFTVVPTDPKKSIASVVYKVGEAGKDETLESPYTIVNSANEITGNITITITLKDKEYVTVKEEITKDGETPTATITYVGDNQPDASKKAEAGKDITFTVTLADEKVFGEGGVQYSTNGGTNKESITPTETEDGVEQYTIPASATNELGADEGETPTVTIYVTTKDKTYDVTFNAETGDQANIGTINYLVQASSATAPDPEEGLTEVATIGTPIPLKKGETIYFVVPESADKKDDERIEIEVSYTVDDSEEDSEPEILEADADGIYKYAADTSVDSRMFNISAKKYVEKEITFAANTDKDVTIAYHTDKDAAASAYTEVDLGENAEPLKFDADKTYYLLITPKAANKSVKGVTLQTSNDEGTNPAPVNAVSAAAGKVYAVTVGAEDAKDEITVNVDETVHFDFPTDENIKGLKYSYTDSAVDDDYEAVPAAGLDIAKGSSIYLKIAVNDNSELIKSNPVVIEYGEGENLTSVNAEAGSKGNYVITGDAEIGSGDDAVAVTDYRVIIYARRQTYSFTLVNSESADIISATDDSVILAATSATVNTVVKQFKGDEYKVKVNPADGNRDAVLKMADSAEDDYEFGIPCEEIGEGSSAYDVYTISSVHNGKFIKAEAAAIPVYNVTVAKADGVKSVTPLKEDGTDDTEIPFNTNASVTLKSGVKEGGKVSFKITLEAESNYIIEKVTAGGKTLEAEEGGIYTLTNITGENCAITIVTVLDSTKANSFTVTADDVATVTVTAPAEAAGPYANKVLTMGKTFSFTVTVLDGYRIKMNEDGTEETGVTAENAEIVKNGNTYTATITAETRTDVAIKVETEAKAAADAKYIKLAQPGQYDKYTIALKTSGLTEVTGREGVYQVPVTVKEVDFEVTVPQDYEVSITPNKVLRQIGSAVKSGEGINAVWTYTYRIAVGAFSAGEATAAAPYEVTPSALPRTITVSLTGESADATVAKVNRVPASLNANGKINVKYGDKVIIGIKAGQELYKVVDGEREEKPCDLDAYNKYLFTVKEEENVFEITDETTDYIVYRYGDEDQNEVKSVSLDYASNNKVDLAIREKADVLDVSKLAIVETKTVLAEGAPALEGTTVAVDEGKTKLTITANGKDAGKNFAVEIYTIKRIPATETRPEKTKKVLAGTVDVTIADAATGITVKNVKANATLKLQADTTTAYAFTTTPAGLDTSLLGASAKVVTDGAVTTTDAGVRVSFAGGNMLVSTPKAAELAEVKVFSKADPENILLTFKVQTSVANPELAKIESPTQGYSNIVITLTPNANVNKLDYSNLYYEVTVNAQQGSAPTGSIQDKTFYFKKKTGEASVTKSIPVNTVADPFKADVETKWKYDFTARLVLVKDNVAVTEGVAGAKLAEDSLAAWGKDKAKTFETRSAYYEDKLGITKKTTKIFSGQEDVLAAVIKYSKNASYLEIATTGEKDSNGFAEASEAVVLDSNNVAVNGFTVKVNNTTNEVKVSAPEYISGKYNVVLYAQAAKADNGDQRMYQATATIPISVVYGIERIDATAPAQVTVLTNKAATITMKPTGYADTYTYNNTKAASQKFTYGLLTLDKKPLAEYGNAELRSHVSVKGSKITIAKGFKAGNDAADNSFIIRVKADDYADNTCKADYTVEITNEYLELGSIYLASSSVSGKELTATTAKEADNSYVVVLDKKGNVVDGSLYTVTGNKNLSPYKNDGIWQVSVNGSAKNVQLKATTLDGGKKTAKSETKYTFGYTTPEAFGVNNYNANVTLADTNNNEYTFKGNAASVIQFSVAAQVSNTFYNYANPNWYNYAVSVKNGRLVKGYNNAYYTLYPNPDKGEVIVTITDKTKKTNNKTEIKYINKTPITTAAPKASTKDKFYGNLYHVYEDKQYKDSQYLNYTVNSRAYTHALISYDSGSFIQLYNGISGYTTADVVVELGENEYTGAYGFTLDALQYGNVTTGTAKFKVVYGHMEDESEANNNHSQFIAETKPAALSIKINKLADFKPQTSYTIIPSVSRAAALTGKPADIQVAYTALQSANVKGKENGFLNWFELSEDGQLMLKSSVTQAQIANVGKEGGIPKDDLTGYVKYRYSIGNGVVEKTAKITVKLNAANPKGYKANAATVLGLASTTAETQIMNGKTSVYVAKAFADSTVWTVANGGTVDDYDISLTASNPAAEQHTVSLYIVEPDSQYLSLVTNLETAKTYGTKVDVKIDVKDKAAYDKKLVFNKKALTVDLGKYEEDEDMDVSWNDAADVKSVQWQANKYMVDGDFTLIANDTLASAVVTDTTLTGIGVSASGSRIVITVNKKDILDKLNKTIKVPVELTFTNGSVKETVTFSVKIPKTLPGLDAAKKVIEEYLCGETTRGSKTADESAYTVSSLNDVLAEAGKEVALSGAVVTAVTVTEIPATDNAAYTSKVTVALEDKASAATTMTAEAELQRQVTTVPKGYDQAAQAVIDAAQKEAAEGGYYVSAKPVADGRKLATDNLTFYEIRNDLQQILDNAGYNYILRLVRKEQTTEATTTLKGAIRITFQLIDRTNLTGSPSDCVAATITTAVKEPTETPQE